MTVSKKKNIIIIEIIDLYIIVKEIKQLLREYNLLQWRFYEWNSQFCDRSPELTDGRVKTS